MNNGTRNGFRDSNPRDISSQSGLLKTSLLGSRSSISLDREGVFERGRLTQTQRLFLSKADTKVYSSIPNAAPFLAAAGSSIYCRAIYNTSTGILTTYTTRDLVSWETDSASLGVYDTNGAGCFIWTGSEFLLVLAKYSPAGTVGFYSATGKAPWTSFTVSNTNYLNNSPLVATANSIFCVVYDNATSGDALITITKPVSASPTVTLTPTTTGSLAGLTYSVGNIASLGCDSPGAIVGNIFYTADGLTFTRVLNANATIQSKNYQAYGRTRYFAYGNDISYFGVPMVSYDGITWTRLRGTFAPQTYVEVQTSEGPLFLSQESQAASYDLINWFTFDATQQIESPYSGTAYLDVFKNVPFQYYPGIPWIRTLAFGTNSNVKVGPSVTLGYNRLTIR